MLPTSKSQPVVTLFNKEPPPPRPTAIAKKKGIDYSSYKLAACCRFIQKRHIFDALAQIQILNKKGAKIVKTVLESARVNALKRGLNEQRLFVKEVIVGRKNGKKTIDIRAKGRHGIRTAPISSITIVVEEMSLSDFYKLSIQGKCPPGLARLMRTMLFQSNVNFEQLKEFSHITTSSGRSYRREQFKRLVQKVKKDYQKKNIFLKNPKIERNILDKAAQKYERDILEAKEQQRVQSRSARQGHFEKNYQKK